MPTLSDLPLENNTAYLRGFPAPFERQKWYVPAESCAEPGRDLYYVAKIQAFSAGGYECTVTRQDLRANEADYISRLLSYRPGKTREKREQNENDIISSINRAKQKCRHTIKSMGCDRLLTLTKRENDPETFWNHDDWKKAWKEFNRLAKKAGSPIDYVAVLEYHKSGAIHLHAAIRGRLNVNLIRRLWYIALGGRGDERGEFAPGGVDIKFKPHITDYQRRAGLAKYVSKYLTKQSELVEFNKKRYWSSRHNLPHIVRYVLAAETISSALCELSHKLSIDASQLLDIAYVFPSEIGAWFNFDARLLAPAPF